MAEPTTVAAVPMAETTMPWWQSRSVWVSGLQVIVGIAVAFGLITPTQGPEIVNTFPDLLIGGTTTVLGLVNAYFRIIATKKLTA